VRRPQSEESSFRSGTPGASTSQPNAHVVAKDREDDYNQARERIIGKSLDVNTRPMNGRGRGYMGRGAYTSTPRSPGGRGTRKAVFRDRDKELQDPDYRRGPSRYIYAIGVVGDS
jgi:U3 small nucleolar RNA-associated protein 19